MLKTPSSTVIGGAFWTPSAMILGGASKTLNQIIKSLFANNEQGFFYDPNDLSTMYQDAAGTVPVTAVGQPVGLVLDKSKGLVLGGNVFVNTVNGYFDSGSTTELLTGTLEKTTAWMSVNPDTFYKIETNGSSADRCRIQVKNASGVISYLTQYSFEGNATYPRYAKTNSDSVLMRIYFKSSAGNATGLIIRAITGNHAYQTTSAARPILRDTPRRIDFDAVDDKLITNLPAQLSGCTVIRSVPNVGTQILTGQIIPATYEDNIDNCGLIVINRALTPSETSAITAELNKRAGV